MKTRDITHLKTLLGVVMTTGLLGISAQGVADPIKFPPYHLNDNFTETVDTVAGNTDASTPGFYESFYAATLRGRSRGTPGQNPAVDPAPWKPKGLAAVWSYSRGQRHIDMLHREYDQVKRELDS